MSQRAKLNALRSGVVVVGTLAFGWLSLELAYKPILRKAQIALDGASQSQPSDHSLSSFDDGFAASDSPSHKDLLDAD